MNKYVINNIDTLRDVIVSQREIWATSESEAVSIAQKEYADYEKIRSVCVGRVFVHGLTSQFIGLLKCGNKL